MAVSATMKRSGKFYKTQEELDEFRSFLYHEYVSGKSTVEIGEEIGFAAQNIWEHLKQTNVNFRWSGQIPIHKEIYVLKLTQMGIYNQREIAEIADVHRHTVVRIQKRNNIYVKKTNPLVCKIHNCNNKHKGYGFCNKHFLWFQRVKKDLSNGRTRTEILKRRRAISKRFLDKYFPKYKNLGNFNHYFYDNLYDAGASLNQIGKVYKVWGNAIKQYLLKTGVEMRPRGGRNIKYIEGPCIECGTFYVGKTGYCKKCRRKQIYQKHRRNKIWSEMNQEHRVIL